MSIPIFCNGFGNAVVGVFKHVVRLSHINVYNGTLCIITLIFLLLSIHLNFMHVLRLKLQLVFKWSESCTLNFIPDNSKLCTIIVYIGYTTNVTYIDHRPPLLTISVPNNHYTNMNKMPRLIISIGKVICLCSLNYRQ